MTTRITGGALIRIYLRDAADGTARLACDTGFRPSYDLETATKDYLAWLEAGSVSSHATAGGIQ